MNEDNRTQTTVLTDINLLIRKNHSDLSTRIMEVKAVMGFSEEKVVDLQS